MTFRHLAAEHNPDENPDQTHSPQEAPSAGDGKSPESPRGSRRKREELDEADVTVFRRVRVTTIRRCGSCGKTTLLSSDGPRGPRTLCADCGLDFLGQDKDLTLNESKRSPTFRTCLSDHSSSSSSSRRPEKGHQMWLWYCVSKTVTY